MELEILGCICNLYLGKVPDEWNILEKTQCFIVRKIASILYDRLLGVGIHLGFDVWHDEFLPISLLVVEREHIGEALVRV